MKNGTCWLTDLTAIRAVTLGQLWWELSMSHWELSSQPATGSRTQVRWYAIRCRHCFSWTVNPLTFKGFTVQWHQWFKGCNCHESRVACHLSRSQTNGDWWTGWYFQPVYENEQYKYENSQEPNGYGSLWYQKNIDWIVQISCWHIL